MVNFQTEVIEKSFHKPVVVDFWAAWCGPCRVLGPVIEGIAAEQSDRWELVKIDTEAHQDLSQQYQIMSIPAVKMFSEGKIVAEFAGALPKSQILKWLDTHLPDSGKSALLALSEAIFSNPEAAIAPLQSFVNEHPDRPEAKVYLAQALVWTQPEAALAILQREGFDPKTEEIRQQLSAIRDVMETRPEEDERVAPVVIRAKEALLAARWAEGLEALIEAVALDKAWGSARARRATVAMFAFLGPRNPISMKYYRRFSAALN